MNNTKMILAPKSIGMTDIRQFLLTVVSYTYYCIKDFIHRLRKHGLKGINGPIAEWGSSNDV